MTCKFTWNPEGIPKKEARPNTICFGGSVEIRRGVYHLGHLHILAVARAAFHDYAVKWKQVHKAGNQQNLLSVMLDAKWLVSLPKWKIRRGLGVMKLRQCHMFTVVASFA